LTLAVTAADLRAGQGYVRCGRCSNVFNALLTLSEEPPEGVGAASDHAASTQSRPALQLVGPTSGDTGEHPAPDESSIETASSRADGTGTFETIVLEGDAILQTEEFVPEEAIDSEIAALNERLSSSARLRALSDSAAANEAVPEPSALPPAVQPVAKAPATKVSAADEAAASEPPAERGIDEPLEFADTQPAGRRRWPWVTGAVVLALWLAGQSIHHWRNQLAAEPLWNGPLTRVYAAIGQPLEPRWDLSAYDVRQEGASSDGGNAIKVRLSLTNHATRPQPLPIVRLTLLDRYGKRVAARDLKPVEYLQGSTAQGSAANTFMAAQQRIDTQVAVQDPGAEASSFEVDVCLPFASGLRCSGDIAHKG
jgi:predicted Zn finger-like uncharacterized protein